MTSFLSSDVANQSENIYSDQEITSLDLDQIPQHVAIIMDGNRRWARLKNQPLMAGHWEGAEALMKTVRAASALGIKTITVYSFSTENWRRSAEEIETLMSLLEVYLKEEKENMVRNGIKLGTIGDISRFPQTAKDMISEVKDATAHGDRIELVLALNYGGRDDICRAVSDIIDDCQQGRIAKEDVTEKMLSSYLDTSAWPDPDLLIRTSGEMRLSNFLLWQVSYAEVYISDVLWPDFDAKHLLKAIQEYQRRDRRLGGGKYHE
ncbi:MAG: isoprenyl transferase [Chlamydiota bacterium]